jgi:hypothetical protein
MYYPQVGTFYLQVVFYLMQGPIDRVLLQLCKDCGRLLKLVDRTDLGSVGENRESSSLSPPILHSFLGSVACRGARRAWLTRVGVLGSVSCGWARRATTRAAPTIPDGAHGVYGRGDPGGRPWSLFRNHFLIVVGYQHYRWMWLTTQDYMDYLLFRASTPLLRLTLAYSGVRKRSTSPHTL